SPELEAGNLVEVGCACTDEDDRECIVAAQPANDLAAVQLRHHNVENRKIDRPASNDVQRLLAVSCKDRVVLFLLQTDLDQLRNLKLVVRDENGRLFHIDAPFEVI